MNIPWYDFEGRWKVVTIAGGHALLAGPEVSFLQACTHLRRALGQRPSVMAAYEVPEEFVSEYRDMYEAKGLFIEGVEVGDGL